MRQLTIEEKYALCKLRMEMLDTQSRLIQLKMEFDKKQADFNTMFTDLREKCNTPKHVLDGEFSWIEEKK